MSRILIVDDESANLDILAAVLSAQGYRVHVASNGRQALDIAARIDPEMVLLDLMMPGIDVLETCRRLKQIPTLADVPIIFLTAVDRAWACCCWISTTSNATTTATAISTVTKRLSGWLGYCGRWPIAPVTLSRAMVVKSS